MISMRGFYLGLMPTVLTLSEWMSFVRKLRNVILYQGSV